ncbi:hypothetical protein KFU94_31175 [Chloroflexi bacterium TSY]|nr:hypothetical protein [Chloroflexi bacterium TSY]
MPTYQLYLFGPPRLKRDNETLELRHRKAIALLAYLAVTKQPHSRDTLATLLWPEYGQSEARTHLRRELLRLRKLMGNEMFDADREQIALQANAPIWIDVDEYRQQLEKSQNCREQHKSAGVEQDLCEICLSFLTNAITCYVDGFMAGFTLSDCPNFDDWQYFESEELHQTLTAALLRLVRGHRAREEFDQAIDYARRWLSLDSLDESAHRELMTLYVQNGQQAAALRQYQACQRILDDELGVPPEDETTELYEAIRTRKFDKTTR